MVYLFDFVFPVTHEMLVVCGGAGGLGKNDIRLVTLASKAGYLSQVACALNDPLCFKVKVNG